MGLERGIPSLGWFYGRNRICSGNSFLSWMLLDPSDSKIVVGKAGNGLWMVCGAYGVSRGPTAKEFHYVWLIFITSRFVKPGRSLVVSKELVIMSKHRGFVQIMKFITQCAKQRLGLCHEKTAFWRQGSTRVYYSSLSASAHSGTISQIGSR